MSTIDFVYGILSRIMEMGYDEKYERVRSCVSRTDRYAMIDETITLVFQNLPFGYYKGQLYYFGGKCYEPVPKASMGALVRDFLLMVMALPAREWYGGLGKRYLENAYDVLQTKQLQPSYSVMAFENGVVDMRLGVLMPHGEQHHVVYVHPYDYDERAECPLWLSFLDQVLPAKSSQEMLQMFLGLGLVDRNDLDEKVEYCLCCYGTGANGKSVVFETVMGLFGRANVSNMGLLSLVKGVGDERLRNISVIEGMRFNYCSEMQASDLTRYSDSFKVLVSGEPQYARMLGENIRTVYQIPYLIFNTNHLLRSKDVSHGFWRRILDLHFTQTIPEEMQNKRLSRDLAAEYPGIMAWVVRGMVALRSKGYVFPVTGESEALMVRHMAENSQVLAYTNAKGMTPSRGFGRVPVTYQGKELYEDFKKFVEYYDLEEWSDITFGKELRRMGFLRGRNNKGITYSMFVKPEEKKLTGTFGIVKKK